MNAYGFLFFSFFLKKQFSQILLFSQIQKSSFLLLQLKRHSSLYLTSKQCHFTVAQLRKMKMRESINELQSLLVIKQTINGVFAHHLVFFHPDFDILILVLLILKKWTFLIFKMNTDK